MKFDELAELYTSMTIRSLGHSLIGVFVPVFLYQVGVSLFSIFMFYTVFFLLRIPVSFLAGKVIGYIGPKHAIAVSTLLFVFFLGLLLTFESFGWPLPFLALFFTISNGLFFIAYNADFSKVNHNKHAGKELGWLYVFERIGGALGPIVGGLLAGLLAPEATMLFAIGVLLGSIVPLMLSAEPVKTHQKVVYRSFKFKRYARDMYAMAGYNVAYSVNITFWPLYIAVAIFTSGTYEKLGLLLGASLAISIVSARMFGSFIDAKKGRNLLKWGVLMNLILNITRSFTGTAGGAVASTVLGEPIALAYRMPLVKGFYDNADSGGDQRVSYLVMIEAATAVAKAIFCLGVALAMLMFDPEAVLRYSFIFVGLISLIMTLQRFPALERV